MNIKNNKVSRFVKKHSNNIIQGGAVLIGTIVIGYCIHRDGYDKGENEGIAKGFGMTIRWCEKNIEDVQLTDKVNTWAQENPEKWCGGLLKKEEA